ncbi:MAG: hypothetical protein Q4F74_04365, partial [Synergistaceae bacterium]|nr:hypothetical protein [Synergistaceae bacterium]
MKKSHIQIALAAIIFVIAAVLTAGCDGGGGGEKVASVACVGSISSVDQAALTNAGIQVLSAAGAASLDQYDSVMLTGIGELSGEMKSAVSGLYNKEDGRAKSIVLLDASSSDIAALCEAIGESFDVMPGDELDDNAEVNYYAVKKEADGDVRSIIQINHKLGTEFCVTNDSSITSADADRVNAVLSGDVYAVYRADSADVYLGAADPADVSKGDKSITVVLGGVSKDCNDVREGDKGWSVYRDDDDADKNFVFEYDIPTTEEAKKAAGLMTDAEKTAEALNTAYSGLKGWLLDDGEDTVKETFSGSDDKEINILKYAKTYCGQADMTWTEVPSVRLQVNSYIVAAHHFADATNSDGGDDVYIITQKCLLNGKCSERHHTYEHGSFTSRVRSYVMHWRNYTYWVGGAEVDEFYSRKYYIRSILEGLTPGSELTLHDAKPEAVNRVTTHKFSHGWHIGADVKASTEVSKKDGPKESKAIAINGGYNTSTEESYTTLDIDTRLNNKAQNQLEWTYDTQRRPERDKLYTKLTYPAELSTSTYSPVHTWVWLIKTMARNKYDSYSLMPMIEVGAVYSRNSGSRSPYTLDVMPQKNGKVIWKGAKIKLPKPSLFALDKDDVIISKKGSDVQVLVFSQGVWEWDK